MQPETQSARSRPSYGKIEDCEQSSILEKTPSSRWVGENLGTRLHHQQDHHLIIIIITFIYLASLYSYISLGPIFEGNDETIGIIGITGHVHLYLLSIKKNYFLQLYFENFKK